MGKYAMVGPNINFSSSPQSVKSQLITVFALNLHSLFWAIGFFFPSVPQFMVVFDRGLEGWFGAGSACVSGFGGGVWKFMWGLGLCCCCCLT